ncbi:LOW QUALITY PROTEIN: hypothetical protein, conserved [Eimeria necatrix]|uniref:Uncharacterized protein n=1 Tax=Eimeria necatrix TaxID=51315 RepID=U6N641_9EIME|nr:LOW QUALITY PROTEIN: hypothetical protein, conserved [Eimeria necatrix]CDJ70150.1 hypothetical protein, conserved [Eimeria necatrix]
MHCSTAAVPEPTDCAALAARFAADAVTAAVTAAAKKQLTQPNTRENHWKKCFPKITISCRPLHMHLSGQLDSSSGGPVALGSADQFFSSGQHEMVTPAISDLVGKAFVNMSVTSYHPFSFPRGLSRLAQQHRKQQ